MTESQGTPKGRFGPFLYLWLALSLLLNISGIASIIDGFVHWASFFRDSLEIYRAWIREPVSWAVHLVWPSWWPKIPAWIFDLFVIWSGLFLAANIWNLKVKGETLVVELFRGENAIRGVLWVVFIFILMPVLLLDLGPIHDRPWGGLEVIMYFLLLVATVIVLAFLNWQFQHLAP